ncbi:hypothetical protein E0L36_17020 [Streptomyces sp. AJS327]|uniref:hypothetical protein n=1 Tax=Streptomyces sp. AJS327 TaxID=2545265 RepID=UPI0015DE396E|nr:hypothetical protein [Streptomyces sp. AJS327]MBA0052523.1 hypothetical protein [Streptomyces sp. AJS327]
MTKVLLSLHVLAAILTVGPITVAASMFPRYARRSAESAARARPVAGRVGHEGDPGPGGGALTAEAEGGASAGEPDAPGRAAGIAALLHGICRGYGVVGVSVPVFGIATGAQLGVLTDLWLVASLILTTGAAALLVWGILPGQRRALGDPEAGTAPAGPAGAAALASRLAMLTGVFNVLWTIVVVLMIVRPGSTTGT